MADLTFRFHPDATAEALVIHDHYFEVAPTLAEDFQNELERSKDSIARSANTWPRYIAETQRFLLKRFPYFVVYRIGDNQMEIIAIAHERQRPGYWVGRIPPE